MRLFEWAGVLREWLQRLVGTVWHRPHDDDLRLELAHHLELEEERLRNQGHSPEEAARLARVRHGHADNALERLRDQRGIAWFGTFTLDVKLGLRMLRKYPGLTLIGGMAITVGICMLTAVFMYFDAVMWNDTVPLDDGDGVVAIQIWDSERGRRSETAIEDFERWQVGLRSFNDVGAFRHVGYELALPDGGEAEVNVAEMSAAGFRVARVAPLIGRTLLEEDERSGAEPVIVIGFIEWQQWFDGDKAVLGRTLRLNDELFTIVGVMPEGFGFPINHGFWIPLQKGRNAFIPAPPAGAVFARLAADVPLETAQAEVSSVGLLTAGDSVEEDEPLRPTVVKYANNFVSDSSPENIASRGGNARLMILLLSLLLVPPSVNIAMLVYARSVVRQEEIAVRTALGANRGRIVAQLFVEMLVLTTLAAILALGGVRIVGAYLEGLFLRSMERLNMERLPFWLDLTPSLNTVLFAALLAVAIALVIGLLPAWRSTSRFARPGLTTLDRRNRAGLGPVWSLLVIAQVGFSFAALPTTVEVAWGVLRAHVLGPGFPADQYLTVRLRLDAEVGESESFAASGDERFVEARARLIDQVEAHPALRSRVSVVSTLPGDGAWVPYRIDDADETLQEDNGSEFGNGVSLARTIRVDENFLDVMEVRILTGRGFLSGEFAETSRSVLVDERFAERAFGGGNPVGRRIRYLSAPGAVANPEAAIWYEIVGVVTDRPAHPYRGSIFHPADPVAIYPSSLIFRTGPDAADLRDRLPAMARSLNPALRAEQIGTLGELYEVQALANYMGGFILIAGGLSVLLLAAAGTHALMSFTVNQRRHEIGVRMALGAHTPSLLKGIFHRALLQVAIGAGIGLGVALLVQGFVPPERIGGLDVPGVLPGAITFMVIIGILAAYGPARRALGVNPTSALRDFG